MLLLECCEGERRGCPARAAPWGHIPPELAGAPQKGANLAGRPGPSLPGPALCAMCPTPAAMPTLVRCPPQASTCSAPCSSATLTLAGCLAGATAGGASHWSWLRPWLTCTPRCAGLPAWPARAAPPAPASARPARQGGGRSRGQRLWQACLPGARTPGAASINHRRVFPATNDPLPSLPASPCRASATWTSSRPTSCWLPTAPPSWLTWALPAPCTRPTRPWAPLPGALNLKFE